MMLLVYFGFPSQFQLCFNFPLCFGFRFIFQRQIRFWAPAYSEGTHLPPVRFVSWPGASLSVFSCCRTGQSWLSSLSFPRPGVASRQVPSTRFRPGTRALWISTPFCLLSLVFSAQLCLVDCSGLGKVSTSKARRQGLAHLLTCVSARVSELCFD
jgi:hypothetical protein